VNFWHKLISSSDSEYHLDKVVHSRVVDDPGFATTHIICDIDKTYLETEFESLLRMAKIAFEAAHDKVTVPGASDVLYLARWGGRAEGDFGGHPHALHFVSSSPPQLRPVLEDKLLLDGLDWNSDTFKNQAYNLRMGRSDLLRHHVGYKSLAILRRVEKAGKNAAFYMIGDNAESDGFIYCGIKFLLSGHLSPNGYRAYLETAGVERTISQDLQNMADGLMRKGLNQTVQAILIRQVPGYQNVEAPPITDVLFNFSSYYEAAILLMIHGVIHPSYLWPLTIKFHNVYRRPIADLDRLLKSVAVTLRSLEFDSEHIKMLAAEVTSVCEHLAHIAAESTVKIESQQQKSPPSFLLQPLHLPQPNYPVLDEMLIVRAARTLWVNLHITNRRRKD
jgi:hypothetical protein